MDLLQNEDKIIGMLEGITNRLDGMDQQFKEVDSRLGQIDKRFGEIDKRFDQIDKRFEQIDQRMDRMDQRFEQMDKRMDGFDQKLELQGETLKEHTHMLSALQTGQTHLKAELDGMKVANEKKFSSFGESLEDHSAKLEVVRDDTWTNKIDIHRIKTTMGMK